MKSIKILLVIICALSLSKGILAQPDTLTTNQVIIVKSMIIGSITAGMVDEKAFIPCAAATALVYVAFEITNHIKNNSTKPGFCRVFTNKFVNSHGHGKINRAKKYPSQ